jgi:adenylyltransferase/sulfurtransferase
MSINIELSGGLAQIAGHKKATVKASTLHDVLEKLSKRYGKEFEKRLFDGGGKPRRFINIYVNGRDYRFLEKLNTKLREGDSVFLIPAVAGG